MQAVISRITILFAAALLGTALPASALTYLEIFDVPPPGAIRTKRPGTANVLGGGTYDRESQSAMTLSERFSLSPEGSRRLKRTDEKFENETNRVRIYRCPVILAKARPNNTEVIIELREQTAYLMVDGDIAMETPVSSARNGKETPRGTFRMTERVRDGKISNLYDVEMPYWMRLDETVFGVHAGYLPGYPASAGCVRLPEAAAQMIYENTQAGTKVSILNEWSPPAPAPSVVSPKVAANNTPVNSTPNGVGLRSVMVPPAARPLNPPAAIRIFPPATQSQNQPRRVY